MKHYMVGSQKVFGLKRAARQAKAVSEIKKADGSELCDAAVEVARRVIGNRS